MQRLSKIFGFVAIVLLALIGLWLVYLTAPRPPQLDTAREQASLRRAFVARIAPEGGEPAVGPIGSWMLEVRYPDGKPVEATSITVYGGMPEHNHGLPSVPTVSADLGDGRYRVEGVKFSMPGRWVLKFKITAAETMDEVVFNVVL